MATPRLRGTTLRGVRALASTGPGIALIRSQARVEYGLDALRELRGTDLSPPAIQPSPLRARDHAWTDQGLGAPVTKRETGRTLREAFSRGALSPVDVLERVWKRVDAKAFGRAGSNPFVAEDREVAREAAKKSEARHREGRALGPLDGIPVPVKDQHHMVGLATRGGTSYRSAPESADAIYIRQLREAGAVLCGKTHVVEWGMTPTGMNAHYDMPRCVYDGDRAAGGSSTGSAVVVGLGLATVATASDGGGSVRNPAAINGVYGFKPTYIRVARGGDLWANNTVSVTGAIGQSTEDVSELVLPGAVGIDPEDVLQRLAPDVGRVQTEWRAALGRGVRGAVIGVPQREWRDCDDALASAGMEALKAFERDGAVLMDIDLPLADKATAIGVISIGVDTLGNMLADLDAFEDRFGDDLRLNLSLLKALSAHEVAAASAARATLRRGVCAAFGKVDLIALPSMRGPAPVYKRSESGRSISDDGAVKDLLRYVFLANLTGVPAASIPVGMHAGLPVGVQLHGDGWDDASVLAAMAHAERIGLGDLPAPEGRQSLLGG